MSLTRSAAADYKTIPQIQVCRWYGVSAHLGGGDDSLLPERDCVPAAVDSEGSQGILASWTPAPALSCYNTTSGFNLPKFLR